MANLLLSKSIGGVEFLNHHSRFADLSRSRRNCPALPDELWLEVGIRRCLGLIKIAGIFSIILGTSTTKAFFEPPFQRVSSANDGLLASTKF